MESSMPFGQSDDDKLLTRLLESFPFTARSESEAISATRQSSGSDSYMSNVERQTAMHSYNNRNNGGNSSTPFK